MFLILTILSFGLWAKVLENSATCLKSENPIIEAQYPDELVAAGEGNPFRCVKNYGLPQNIYDKVQSFILNEDINETDYDSWLTGFYHFGVRNFPQKNLSFESFDYFLEAFGEEASLPRFDKSFGFYDLESLPELKPYGLGHLPAETLVVRKYLKKELAGASGVYRVKYRKNLWKQGPSSKNLSYIFLLYTEKKQQKLVLLRLVEFDS